MWKKIIIYVIVAALLVLNVPEMHLLAETSSVGERVAEPVAENMIAQPNEAGTVYTLLSQTQSSVTEVRYGVWSEKKGIEKTIWYQAEKDKDGRWKAEVKVSDFGAEGMYYAHAYIIRTDGSAYYAGCTEFRVEGPGARKITVSNMDTKKGTFDLVVTGIFSKAGVKKVQIPVWSREDQKDIKWYDAVLREDGSYTVHVDYVNHQYNYGTYTAHVFVTDQNGIYKFVAGTYIDFSAPKGEVTVKPEEGKTSYVMEIPDVYAKEYKIIFGVWSHQKGLDSTIWYPATKSENGKWISTMRIEDFGAEGVYFIHAYIQNSRGTSYFIDDAMIDVDGPTATGIVAEKIDGVNGTAKLVINGVQAKAGVKKVQVPIWSREDQKDIKWYEATLQPDGTYVVNMDIRNHRNFYGKYTAHVFVLDHAGIFKFVAGTYFDLQQSYAKKVTATPNAQHTRYDLAATGLENAAHVRFGVWSDLKGIKSSKWYDAKKDRDGNWQVPMSVTDFSAVGIYYVHAYAIRADGTAYFAGDTAFVVTGPLKAEVFITNLDDGHESFTVRAENVISDSPITSVTIPVWCQSDQSDIIWYPATKVADGVYEVCVEVKNHNRNIGLYQAHVYVKDANGFEANVGATSQEIREMKYSIMGEPSTTVEQMVRFFNSKNTYPSFYATSDAPTIEDFCRMYMEECMAEGVKTEVAFCQSMKETGFLKYPGDARIEQFNFAGLDTTGKQPDGTVDRGRSYSCVREGIRAHVQRLKAYAVKGTTPESYAYPCIDPDKFDSKWWRETIVGCSPYVDWLGKNQNPTGYGWATEPTHDYGASIINDYIAKLFQF